MGRNWSISVIAFGTSATVRGGAASLAVVCACAAVPAPVTQPNGGPPAPSASSAIAEPAPPPEPRVAARWILHEEIGNTSRWLLVAGTVKRGTENDPPADADYVILKQVDEAFARSAGLPVRTLTVPRVYLLPEPFTVTLHVDSEPPGARIYEVAPGGALVSLGKAPVDVTYAGTVSDLKTNLMGGTWLTPGVENSGVSVGLWAATDSMTSAPGTEPTSVPLLGAADIDALRHGTNKISKSYTLAVHTPIAPASVVAVTRAYVVDTSFFAPGS